MLKTGYLNALADTRAGDHDLTPFLKFALKGVESQCRLLFGEIRAHLTKKTRYLYTVRNPEKALNRDLNYLVGLAAIRVKRQSEGDGFIFSFHVNLDWPTQITETEFFRLVKALPKGQQYGFLSK